MKTTKKKDKVTVLLSKPLKDWIVEYSAKTGLSQSGIVLVALNQLRSKNA
jgi:hypothetical protein